MCGRFTQLYTWAEVYAFLNLINQPGECEAKHRSTTNLVRCLKGPAIAMIVRAMGNPNPVPCGLVVKNV